MLLGDYFKAEEKAFGYSPGNIWSGLLIPEDSPLHQGYFDVESDSSKVLHILISSIPFFAFLSTLPRKSRWTTWDLLRQEMEKEYY